MFIYTNVEERQNQREKKKQKASKIISNHSFIVNQDENVDTKSIYLVLSKLAIVIFYNAYK